MTATAQYKPRSSFLKALVFALLLQVINYAFSQNLSRLGITPGSIDVGWLRTLLFSTWSIPKIGVISLLDLLISVISDIALLCALYHEKRWLYAWYDRQPDSPLQWHCCFRLLPMFLGLVVMLIIANSLFWLVGLCFLFSASSETGRRKLVAGFSFNLNQESMSLRYNQNRDQILGRLFGAAALCISMMVKRYLLLPELVDLTPIIYHVNVQILLFQLLLLEYRTHYRNKALFDVKRKVAVRLWLIPVLCGVGYLLLKLAYTDFLTYHALFPFLSEIPMLSMTTLRLNPFFPLAILGCLYFLISEDLVNPKMPSDAQLAKYQIRRYRKAHHRAWVLLWLLAMVFLVSLPIYYSADETLLDIVIDLAFFRTPVLIVLMGASVVLGVAAVIFTNRVLVAGYPAANTPFPDWLWMKKDTCRAFRFHRVFLALLVSGWVLQLLYLLISQNWAEYLFGYPSGLIGVPVEMILSFQSQTILHTLITARDVIWGLSLLVGTCVMIMSFAEDGTTPLFHQKHIGAIISGSLLTSIPICFWGTKLLYVFEGLCLVTGVIMYIYYRQKEKFAPIFSKNGALDFVCMLVMLAPPLFAQHYDIIPYAFLKETALAVFYYAILALPYLASICILVLELICYDKKASSHRIRPAVLLMALLSLCVSTFADSIGSTTAFVLALCSFLPVGLLCIFHDAAARYLGTTKVSDKSQERFQVSLSDLEDNRTFSIILISPWAALLLFSCRTIWCKLSSAPQTILFYVVAIIAGLLLTIGSVYLVTRSVFLYGIPTIGELTEVQKKKRDRLIPIWDTTLKLHRRYVDLIICFFIGILACCFQYTHLPDTEWFRIISQTTGIVYNFNRLPVFVQDLLKSDLPLIFSGIGFLYQTVWIIVLKVRKRGRTSSGIVSKEHRVGFSGLNKKEADRLNAEHAEYLQTIANQSSVQKNTLYRLQGPGTDTVVTERELFQAHPISRNFTFQVNIPMNIAPAVYVTKLM